VKNLAGANTLHSDVHVVDSVPVGLAFICNKCVSICMPDSTSNSERWYASTEVPVGHGIRATKLERLSLYNEMGLSRY
jgi:hypothetical protein